MHKTDATTDGVVMSDVDELYRLALGLENPRTYSRDTTRTGATGPRIGPVDYGLGWQADNYRGSPRFSAYGVAGGKRNAFVRIPDKHAAIIVLTNDDSADAKSIADKLTDRLFTPRK